MNSGTSRASVYVKLALVAAIWGSVHRRTHRVGADVPPSRHSGVS
jgi:hypothetical protein